jgi:DNA-binding transcriptional regulator YdaS (Cro superfamily)
LRKQDTSQLNKSLTTDENDAKMESDDLVMSKTNQRRIRNLRAVCARYEQQNDVVKLLGWTPSYLSQLIGPNPTRPVSEKTARGIEAKLKLATGVLESEAPPPELRGAVSADLLDNVMVAVDTAMEVAGWKLSDEKYRALVSHLYKAHSKRGATQVDRDEVDALLRLVR